MNGEEIEIIEEEAPDTVEEEVLEKKPISGEEGVEALRSKLDAAMRERDDARQAAEMARRSAEAEVRETNKALLDNVATSLQRDAAEAKARYRAAVRPLRAWLEFGARRQQSASIAAGVRRVLGALDVSACRYGCQWRCDPSGPCRGGCPRTFR